MLARLDEIGASLQRTGRALALLGLGSVGTELQRLDEFSDLDFFAIVMEGQKEVFLRDLSWLSSIAPVAYLFRNTVDGYKMFFEDGIFCEFAVFEQRELAGIPFAAGRIVWKAPGVEDSIRIPVRQNGEPPSSREWLLGEALTNLYVGLCRHRRGEKLSAQRFIQHHAVDKVLKLVAAGPSGNSAQADVFSVERRFEARFPDVASLLPEFVQGYDRNVESAIAIIRYLDVNFGFDPFVKRRMEELTGKPL